MPKRRFRNRIKSTVGGLIDPEKDDELKGSNIEMEDNYKKIIEILKEEDQEHKNKLIGLIEEFHNRYQSIYNRYDHITGKLKEKVQSKKEKESSSSSSSDSDDSLNKKESKNGKLKNKIHMAANTEIDELKRKLAVETEEKEALNSQVEETEKLLTESKLQSDRLHEENSKLLADNRELNLKLENYQAVETELSQKIEDIKKESTSLMLEKETAMTTVEELSTVILQLKGEKAGFESELEDVKCEFSKIQEKLTTTEYELSKQTEMHESFKKETEIKIMGIEEELDSLKLQKTEIEKQKQEEILALEKNYEEKIDNLQKELEFLHLEVNEKQVEVESINTQKLESDKQIEFLKVEITNKNVDQDRLLEEKEIHEFKIKLLQKQIEEMSKEIENGLQSKEQIVEQLEETIEDLKSDLEIKGDEIYSLTETVRNLEVKIRLSNQKLRVTEQMLNETEHDHATKEEKLHQENKILMDKISTLSQTITSVKREVQENVNEMLTGIDSLTVKFEEDYGHVTTRVYEIRNEIQAVMVQLKQYQLEKEDVKQKLEEMMMKLEASKGENDKLMMGLAKKDEKIKELENTIHVKEEWILGLGEGKREAIKQLCIWADYQRDRSDHLQEQLLKTTTAAQRRMAVR